MNPASRADAGPTGAGSRPDAEPGPVAGGWTSARIQLLAVFGGALALRLLLALVILPDGGHRSDLGILTDWAHELARNGPGAFYRPGSGYFADYPPVYLYVLWITGLVGSWLGAAPGAPDITPFMLKLPLIAADLAAAGFLFLLVRRIAGPREAGLPGAGHRNAVIAAAAFLFNPAIILVSTIWGQNDPFATAAVLAAAWLLASDRLEWASVAACVALLVKFQYGFMVPIVGLVAIRRDLLGLSGHTPNVRRLLRTGLVGALAIIALCLPFGLLPISPDDPAHSLVSRLVAASSAFPGVTQNAFNLWMNPLSDVVRTGASGLTEGHVVDDTVALVTVGGLGLTAQWIGNLLFVVAVILSLAVLRRRDDALAVCFVALALAVAFFALPTRIHERYLYPAIAFAIPFLWTGRRSWRLLFVAVSGVLFLDAYWVYTLPIGNAGPGRGFLADTVYSPAGIYLVSFVTDAVLAWLLWSARRPDAIPAGRDVAEAPGTSAPGAVTEAPGVTEAAVDAERPGEAEKPGQAERPGELPGEAPPPRRPRTPPAAARALAAVERLLAVVSPGTIPTVGLFAVVAVIAAIVAARVGWLDGPWLWNLDMPKIDYPLASFFHDALAAGRLPLWEDHLGLGFPLYAEGQVGAFYPPNWLLFQLPPLAALDATRVLHLALAGVGTGLIGLRLTGSRAAALIGLLVAVLGGAIATKLEWTNLVAAYGWMPWVLLPFVARRVPSRRAVAIGGVLWGVQALAGHPNTWLLTGLTAALLMLASAPRLATVGRLVAFALIGGAVGAVQLLPTAILTTLSVRSTALSATDLFASAATPFDLLGAGFANAFALPDPGGSWDIFRMWYPDGTFALLEAGVYVGLPVLALAAAGAGARRARPLLVAAAILLAIPVVAAFQPSWWTAIPVVNALRSPVRAYVVVALLLGVLASIGAARVRSRLAGRRWRSPLRAAAAAVLLVAGAYGLILGLAMSNPGLFDGLVRFSSSFLDPANLPAQRRLAIETLSRPLPALAELLLAGATLAAIAIGTHRVLGRRTARLALAGLVAVPLLLFGHEANGTAPLPAFSSAGSGFVAAARTTAAHRLLTLGEPGWYEGMPDELAAAGVPDIRMFSSLDLAATDALVGSLRRDGADAEVRQAVGIDVVVTYGRPCPGTLIASDPATQARFCRDEAALAPPYWIPLDRAAPAGGSGSSSPIAPADMTVRTSGLGSVAVRPTAVDSVPGHVVARVDAPAAGWVWIDRAWWPGWDVTVDGSPVAASRALGGLLVPVGAGSHEIVAQLVPRDALLGAAAGVIAVLLAVAWVRSGERRRPR